MDIVGRVSVSALMGIVESGASRMQNVNGMKIVSMDGVIERVASVNVRKAGWEHIV